ncbi:MAG: hypothetical protein QM765_08125 [Myxococcales bacterium]
MNWSDSFAPYGKGRITEPAGLKDAALSNRLAAYKRQVAKRYRVLEPEEIEKQLPKGQLWISTKLDGELWFLVKREGEVALCAYNGRVLTGVPITDEAAKKLEKVDSIVVAGELLAALPGTEGRPRCFHVSRSLGDPTLAEHLTFHPFDVVEDGGKEVADRAYSDRHQRLSELFGQAGRISVVATQEGDAAAAAGCYREWVATQKFEGIVVRSEQGLTYKIKPTFTIDALVVAYGERVVNGVNQLRELELALRRDDGSFQIIGSCGGGFSEDDRVVWREKLTKLKVSSSFRLANREGTLCHFVEPKVVVEIRCNDLVDSDGNDCAIARMAVAYKEGEGYSAIGPMPIVSLVSPRFLRERTDKTTDVGSIGLEQVFSRLPFDSRFNAPVAAAKAEPAVIERKAFVKGETMVRKYVAIATNRPHDRNYPPFVVHFTDYSAGRAEAMKVAIRTAATKESLDKHIAAWVEENVKKGWLEFGAPAPAAPVKVAAPKKRTKAAAAAEGAEAVAAVAAATPAEVAAPAEGSAAPAPAVDAAAAPAKPKRTRAKKAETESA